MAKEQPTWRWWMMNGGDHYTLLQNLAMKILSQCFANSSLERNWIMYKYVHSTICNWLLTDRADKLVYMYCNEKILGCIESPDYEEDMPVWMYDCQSGNADQYGEKAEQIWRQKNESEEEEARVKRIGRSKKSWIKVKRERIGSAEGGGGGSGWGLGWEG